MCARVGEAVTWLVSAPFSAFDFLIFFLLLVVAWPQRDFTPVDFVSVSVPDEDALQPFVSRHHVGRTAAAVAGRPVAGRRRPAKFAHSFSIVFFNRLNTCAPQHAPARPARPPSSSSATPASARRAMRRDTRSPPWEAASTASVSLIASFQSIHDHTHFDSEQLRLLQRHGLHHVHTVHTRV